MKIYDCCSESDTLHEPNCESTLDDNWSIPINGHLYSAQELKEKKILEYRKDRVKLDLNNYPET